MMADVTTYYVYRSPVGALTLRANAQGLVSLVFGAQRYPDAEMRPTRVTTDAANEILEYLAGKRRIFTVPLSMAGTDFQCAVWRAVRSLPYATTATCEDIATMAGHPGARRLVGQALNANPLPLLIPDHRVVAADGGPLGTGDEAKRRSSFLEFERRQTS